MTRHGSLGYWLCFRESVFFLPQERILALVILFYLKTFNIFSVIALVSPIVLIRIISFVSEIFLPKICRSFFVKK